MRPRVAVEPDRPPQGPRRRPHQRRPRRRWPQLQPPPAMVRGALARPIADAPVHPTGATRRLIPAARDVLHGRPNLSKIFVDRCCYAWKTLIDQPWKIISTARRDWAIMDYSI